MAKRKSHMSHSGQTAMEYLLTYGWAILVVLVVIGALVFFGVLSPQRFLPAKCDISGDVKCTAFKIGTASTQLKLLGASSSALTITSITVKKQDGTVCGTRLPVATTGTADLKVLGPGAESTYTITCAHDLPTGTRAKLPFDVAYTDQGSGFTHTGSGTIVADIE